MDSLEVESNRTMNKLTEKDSGLRKINDLTLRAPKITNARIGDLRALPKLNKLILDAPSVRRTALRN